MSSSKWDTPRLTALAALVAFGAAIRLAGLGRQSFWLDEAFSVVLARAPWRAFAYQLRTSEANMGVYFVLLRPWERLGADEAHVRLLSAIAGIATIPMVAAVAGRLFGRAVGLTAAAILALDPLDIWASQEARGYALVILLVTCSTWAFVRAVGGDADPVVTDRGTAPRSPSRRGVWWALYVLASALAVYTHVYAAFVLLAQWLSLAVPPPSIRWRALVLSGVALAVLLVPLMLFIISRPHGNIDWIQGTLGPNPTEIWRTVRPTLSAAGAVAACGYVAVCSATLWAGIRMTRRATTPAAQWAYLIVVLWLVLPVAIPLAISITLKPVLNPRYVTICAPAVAIVAAAMIAQAGGAWRVRLLAAVVAFELFGDWAYFSAFHKEDWRDVTRTMLADARAGDVAIFYAPYVRRPFDYYLARPASPASPPSRSPRVLYPSARYSDFTLDTIVPLSLAGALDSARAAPRLWLILSHTIRADSTCAAALESALTPVLQPIDERHFVGGVEVRLYARSTAPGVHTPNAATAISRACPQA